jgi:hypothetical protein
VTDLAICSDKDIAVTKGDTHSFIKLKVLHSDTHARFCSYPNDRAE